MITVEPVNMGGVILANFIVSSHIKVVPGSVYKAFLTIDNIPVGDFANTTITDLIQESIFDLLTDFLSFEFDDGHHDGKSVDWSYNITYKSETFKTRVLSVTARYVEVYVLVAPHKENSKKIQNSLDQLVNFCLKEYTVIKLEFPFILLYFIDFLIISPLHLSYHYEGMASLSWNDRCNGLL